MQILKSAIVLCACLALVPSGPALSQARSDALFAALGHVPAEIFEGEERWQLDFGDTRAVMPAAVLGSLNGSLAAEAEVISLGRVLPSRFRYMEIVGDRMQQAIGIRPGDIETILNLSYLPLTVDVLTLRDGAGALLEQGLLAAGFAAEMRDGRTFLWRGESDLGIDFGRVDPANPFGGDLGRSARLLISGETILHGPAWPLVEAMAAEDGATSMAHDPLVQTMGRALDHEDAGAGALAFAMVLREADGSGLMVADLSHGAAQSGLLVLSAADESSAEALAATVARNWTEAQGFSGIPFADLFETTPVISVVDGRPSAVMVRIDGSLDPASRFLENREAMRLLQIIMAGDLGALTAP